MKQVDWKIVDDRLRRQALYSRVIPDIFHSIVAKKDSIKKCKVGQNVGPNKPIDHDDTNGEDGEANGNIYNHLVGIVTAKKYPGKGRRPKQKKAT